ncbi:hypothetical protein D3C86_2029090 [compost metagenome]
MKLMKAMHSAKRFLRMYGFFCADEANRAKGSDFISGLSAKIVTMYLDVIALTRIFCREGQLYRDFVGKMQ